MTVDIVDDIQMQRMVGGVVLLNICMSFGIFGIVNGAYLQLGPVCKVTAVICLYLSVQNARYGYVLVDIRYMFWCIAMFMLGFIVGGAEHSFVIDYISYSIIITFAWSCGFLIATMFMRDWLGIAPASGLVALYSIFLIQPDFLYLYMYGVLVAIHCGFVYRARFEDTDNDMRALMHIGAMFVVPSFGPIFVLCGCDDDVRILSNAKLMF